jgi:rubrerythrin
MDEKKFQEIVEFAIQKEMEAVDFYTRASGVVKHSGTKALFLDFAKQEEGHKRLLENLSMEKVVHANIEKIPNLKISDYLVDTDFRPDISYADILRIAMKREEHSIKLYNDLKPLNGDEALTKLFNFLIQEETKHKYALEKIYDDEILK